MIFAILNIILMVITLIFNLIVFLTKVIIKCISFILCHSLLRTLALLIILKYLLHLSIELVSSLYFLFITYKAAEFFKINLKIKQNIMEFMSKINNNKKLSHSLQKLKDNYILLRNLSLENDDDSSYIENLLICGKGIFNIKNLAICNNNSNDDVIIPSANIDSLAEDLAKSNNLLEDIIPAEVPIINIITLADDNLVIKDTSQLTSAVICTKNLSRFIEKNFSDLDSINSGYLKELILENNRWKLDCFISSLLNFLWKNKSILLFFSIFAILYYFYSILVLTLL